MSAPQGLGAETWMMIIAVLSILWFMFSGNPAPSGGAKKGQATQKAASMTEVGKSIRLRLGGSCIVTFSAPLEAFLEMAQQPSARSRPILLELAAATDLFLILESTGDEMNSEQLTILRDAGVLLGTEPHSSFGVKPHRVLFCSTEKGKTAFVQQLEPALHISYGDGDTESMQALAKVPNLGAMLLRLAQQEDNARQWISDNARAQIANSLDDFFNL